MAIRNRHIALRLVANLFAVGLTCVACSGHNQTAQQVPTPALTPEARAKADLVRADIDTFAQLNSETLAAFDASNGGVFTAIFGGASGDAVRNYFDARIKLVATDPNQLKLSLDAMKLPYSNWLKDGKAQPSDVLTNAVSAQLAAVNVGTTLWYQSIINRTPFLALYFDKTIPVDSSRIGIMTLGPAYATHASTSKGPLPLPPAYRQAVLVHEARHSDCTGGITEADLDVARAATDSSDFLQNFKDGKCGHFHSICPDSTGGVAGLLACDDQPWGAYTIGYLFLRAVASGLSEQSDDWSILDMSAADNFTRLQFSDRDAVLKGLDGAPDMTSAGLQ